MGSLVVRFEVGIVVVRERKGIDSNAKRGILSHQGLELANIDAREWSNDLEAMANYLVLFLRQSR